jgi:hypothetical protein
MTTNVLTVNENRLLGINMFSKLAVDSDEDINDNSVEFEEDYSDHCVFIMGNGEDGIKLSDIRKQNCDCDCEITDASTNNDYKRDLQKKDSYHTTHYDNSKYRKNYNPHTYNNPTGQRRYPDHFFSRGRCPW